MAGSSDGPDFGGDVMADPILILIALLAGAPLPPSPPSQPPTMSVSTIIIRSQLSIRVPMRHPLPATDGTNWREKKGPKCVEASALAGAAVSSSNSVDFILRGGDRIRARLESACPALDYYSGFYISPTADAKICADRDAIHARSGGECGIDRFRRLVPGKR